MKEILQNLLVDEINRGRLYPASLILWGMLIGDLTKEEVEEINKRVMTLEAILSIFSEKD